MSPQMTTLGTIGVGNSSYVSYRTKSSGIYRPEENANMQNYRYQIDCYEAFNQESGTFTSTNRAASLNLSNGGKYCQVITTNDSITTVITFTLQFNWAFNGTVSSTTTTIGSDDVSATLPVVRDGRQKGITSSPDGTHFFISSYGALSGQGSYTGGRIYKYQIKSGRESFAGIFNFTNYDFITSVSINSQTIYPWGIKLNPDGTKLYVMKQDSNVEAILQYSMSSAYDLSTLSYQGQMIWDRTLDIYNMDIAFSDDGKKLYVLGLENSRIYQLNLNTAWDITAGHSVRAEFLYRGFYTGQDKSSSGLFFKPDGLSFFTVGYAYPTGDLYPLGIYNGTETRSLLKYNLIVN